MGGYDKSVWAFIGKLSAGEMPSVGAGNHLCFLKYYCSSTILNYFQVHKIHKCMFSTYLKLGEGGLTPIHRSDSLESTQSEREFKKKYQAITHRMVHRKSSAVMYSKILERTFGKLSIFHNIRYSSNEKLQYIWRIR